MLGAEKPAHFAIPVNFNLKLYIKNCAGMVNVLLFAHQLFLIFNISATRMNTEGCFHSVKNVA